MKFKIPWRKTALLAVCFAAGAAALGTQALLQTPVAPDPGEYFLTEYLRAVTGPVSIGLALLLAAALGYLCQIPGPAVGLAMVAIFPLVIAYETTAFPGSHNLVPFELAVVVLMSIPLMLAAAGGCWSARRRGRRDLWDGDSLL